MRKRMIVLLLALALLSGLCLNAVASERAARVNPRLTFSGTTANCSVTVTEAGKIEATLELWSDSTLIDSWQDSGTNFLTVSGSHSVRSGTAYTLIAYGIAGGNPFRTSTSGTCP